MHTLDYPFDSGDILRKQRSIKRHLAQQDGLIEKRIAILSGSTIGEISGVLELFLLSFGIKPQFYIGQYNRFYEEVLFETQQLIDFSPDIIFIHTSARNLSDDEISDKLQAVWSKIQKEFACPVIQNNFELPNYCFAEECDKTNRLNLKISDWAMQSRGFCINDIQYLSACYGLENWFHEQDYLMYKYGFSVKAIPLFCFHVAKLVKSLYGKNQKCLVLDLDNTLWGGVVGEIGASAIEIGPETALGEAYSNFQRYVKGLHNRGIILAICSKNDEHIAREAFENPNMVLQLDDIAVFCANWENKADNIRKIAGMLNILTESIVFIDDNPAERELVRHALPEVKVPEVNSVVDFIRYIEDAGYFYTQHVSDEDVKRNEYYKTEFKRAEAIKTFTGYGDYLRSLQMSSKIRPFDAVSFDRITQLINKTNQFNLTTKRYSSGEIEEIALHPDFISLYATLDDKFGNNGIVSVLIGEVIADALHIRLWVMSCRVFKRELELAIFDYLVQVCKDRQLKQLVGYYYKTGKNAYVSGLLDDLGFQKLTDDTWSFSLDGEYQNKNKYIQVKRENA